MSKCADCIYEPMCYKLTDEYFEWDVFDVSEMNNVENKCKDFIKNQNLKKDYTPLIAHLREDWAGHREEAAEAIEELVSLVEWYESIRNKKPDFTLHDGSHDYD